MPVACCLLLAAGLRAADPASKPAGDLSSALRQAADAIDGEIAVTCLCDKDSEKYLPAMRALLDRLGQYKKGKVAVTVAATPEQRRQALTALRELLADGPPGFAALSKDFKAIAKARAAECTAAAEQWSGLPEDCWLKRINLAKAIARAMDDDAERYRAALEALPSDGDRGLVSPPIDGDAGLLPDHAGMVEAMDEALRADVETLRQIDQAIRQVAAARAAAAKACETLPVKTAGVNETLAKTIAAIGKPDAPLPADAKAALTEFVANCRAVAGAANEAAKAITDFDESAGGLAQAHARWKVGEAALPAVYQALVERACKLADQAEEVAAGDEAETKKNVVVRARQLAPRLLEDAKTLGEASGALAKEFTAVDKASADLLAAVGDRKALAPLARIVPVLTACRTLPKAPDTIRLSRRIGKPNVLLVRAGKRLEAVGFEEQWPLADGGRVFNGEAALAEALRCVSGKPVGQVVLAYHEFLPPPAQAAWVPASPGPIRSGQLSVMRAALERAGLTVVDWNMAAQVDPPTAPPGREGSGAAALPQVLLVLPPPPPPPAPAEGEAARPGWTAHHADSLAAAIRKCGSAVFLVGYAWPPRDGKSPEYLLGDYLRRNWGIAPRTDLRLVRGTPAAGNDGTSMLNVRDWTYLPLSSFGSHCAGAGLKGRRALWLDACPVTPAEPPAEGVTVENVLTVPAGQDCWAAVDPLGLARRLMDAGGQAVQAAPGEGDLKAPQPVVVAARKTAGGQTTRIVVMGVGHSVVDAFVQPWVPTIDPGGGLRADEPPTEVLGLLVNSLYHVLGKDELIGPPPVAVKP